MSSRPCATSHSADDADSPPTALWRQGVMPVNQPLTPRQQIVVHGRLPELARISGQESGATADRRPLTSDMPSVASNPRLPQRTCGFPTRVRWCFYGVGGTSSRGVPRSPRTRAGLSRAQLDAVETGGCSRLQVGDGTHPSAAATCTAALRLPRRHSAHRPAAKVAATKLAATLPHRRSHQTRRRRHRPPPVLRLPRSTMRAKLAVAHRQVRRTSHRCSRSAASEGPGRLTGTDILGEGRTRYSAESRPQAR